MLVQDVHNGRAREGQPAGQELEGDDGQRVEVRLAGRLAAPGLLGGHVRGGSRDRPAHGARVLAVHLGQPEVGQDRLPLAVEEHVGRLDVAMDDALGVGVVEGVAERLQDVERLLGLQRLLGKPLLEGAVGHVLGDHVGLSVEVAEIEHREDVAVAEPGHRPGLPLEPLAGFLGVTEGRQQLDRGPALEARVVGAVDHAHAATSERALDHVGADAGASRDASLHCRTGL